MKSVFILSICIISALVDGRCQLQEHHISNERRIVIKYANDQLNLLRELSVEDGTVLYWVCNNNDVTVITCENGQFNTSLPLPMCYNYLKPQLSIADNKKICPHRLYHIGFSIQCQDNGYFFETYKVCFDHDRMRSVFTIHEAYPFVLRRPGGMQFDPDEIFTMRYFSAYNKRDIYAQFGNLLGHDQRLMPPNAGDERIDRGHLTPVTDFFMIGLLQTTFKLINAIPQFHTINDGNWKHIEEWVRNAINTPAKVCTGALPYVLQLPDTQGNLREMYLRDNVIPIPAWIYKIVLNRQNIRYVFLTLNNIHEKTLPPHFPSSICNPVQCPSNLYLQNSNYFGYTYCCDPEHFIRTNVPNLQGQC